MAKDQTTNDADRDAAVLDTEQNVNRETVAQQREPLTNEAMQRGPRARVAVENDAAMTERARQETLRETGQEPGQIEHHSLVPPVNADEAPGAFFTSAGSTYIVGMRDIFASSVGQFITSYTLDSAAVSADTNGDKLVMEGTVLQASGAKVAPRTSGAAVGVCRERVNLRYGDADIGMIVGGRLRADKLWDNGVFGSVAAGAVTQLAALGIQLTTYDI